MSADGGTHSTGGRRQWSLVVLAVAGLAVVACSGDDQATQPGGSAEADFCALADAADRAGDRYDQALASGAADELRQAITAALEAARAAASAAPAELAETIEVVLDGQERMFEVLERAGFDVGEALLDDEFVELATGEDLLAARGRLDAYLSDRCGITPDTSLPRPNFVLSDDPARAAEQFLRLYEIGSGVTITSEQRACLVRELAKLSRDDLASIVAGDASEESSVKLGLAFVACDFVPG